MGEDDGAEDDRDDAAGNGDDGCGERTVFGAHAAREEDVETRKEEADKIDVHAGKSESGKLGGLFAVKQGNEFGRKSENGGVKKRCDRESRADAHDVKPANERTVVFGII